jgi:hypothetical protein
MQRLAQSNALLLQFPSMLQGLHMLLVKATKYFRCLLAGRIANGYLNRLSHYRRWKESFFRRVINDD